MSYQAFCIHGHFYQPPREDPLTGIIPLEPGAAPYRNWNERIFAECYRPNAEQGNFKRISFNIGPTLFNWMAGYDLATCQKIVDQDRLNVGRYGVGNAMAQAYNHSILPLATRQDKITQIKWGIADFSYRFGRKPKGMWLPETAVDQETLEVMADCGIEFTILAPWQGDGPVPDQGIPCRVPLAGGREMTVFFYNQDLSTRISFDPGATINADDFVIRSLAPKFSPGVRNTGVPQMIMVASDGELYGHHQPFREKFLAYLLDGALTGRGLTPTFPELWLKSYPARQVVHIRDNTSWSCHHGVLRWSKVCGCTAQGRWKAPLRRTLNLLAKRLDVIYEMEIRPYTAEPWELRNQYIHVLLGEQKFEDLVNTISGRRLPDDDLWRIRLLLEAQRERQRMFTSCGWFFDDFDRIEPKNNVAYAAQAVLLTRQATGVDLAARAMGLFSRVRSQCTGLQADTIFANSLNRAQANLGG